MIGNTNARVNSASGIYVTDKANLKGNGTTEAYSVQDYENTLASKVQSYTTAMWSNGTSSWTTEPPYTCYIEVAEVPPDSHPVIGFLPMTTSSATVKNRAKAFGCIDTAATGTWTTGGTTRQGIILKAYNKNPGAIAAQCGISIKGY